MNQLSDATAISMLALAMAGEPRPVDDLIRRLRHADGLEWVAQMTRAGGRAPLEAGEIGRLIDGQLSLDGIISMKERCKERAANSASSNVALISLALYCLCVAAALVQHATMISTQPRADWQLLLIDLADVAPPQWRPLLTEAAARMT